MSSPHTHTQGSGPNTEERIERLQEPEWTLSFGHEGTITLVNHSSCVCLHQIGTRSVQSTFKHGSDREAEGATPKSGAIDS